MPELDDLESDDRSMFCPNVHKTIQQWNQQTHAKKLPQQPRVSWTGVAGRDVTHQELERSAL
jgi:hypothetical protein